MLPQVALLWPLLVLSPLRQSCLFVSAVLPGDLLLPVDDAHRLQLAVRILRLEIKVHGRASCSLALHLDALGLLLLLDYDLEGVLLAQGIDARRFWP